MKKKTLTLLTLFILFSCSSIEDKKVFEELSIDDAKQLIQKDKSYSEIVDAVSLFYKENKNQPSMIARYSDIKLKDLKDIKYFLLDTTNYKRWREEYLKTDNIDILQNGDSILNEYRKIYFDWGSNNEYLKIELEGAKDKSLSYKYNFIKNDFRILTFKAIVYDKESKNRVAFDRVSVFDDYNGRIKKSSLTEYDDETSLKFKNLEDFLERYIIRLELDSEYGVSLKSFERKKQKHIAPSAINLFEAELKGSSKELIALMKNSFIKGNISRNYQTESEYLKSKSYRLASEKYPLISEFYNIIID